MSFAEDLKNQLDIIQVIEQYVRLKPAGAGPSYLGLCPFHSEKTPSFRVHSQQRYYKCFGCDAGGDVFKFIMEIEGLTFPETLKLLAERYGIPMPERPRYDDPEAARREALSEMHESAAALYQDNLRGPQGAEARRYLEDRGVPDALVHEFRLGLADTSGNQLAQRLQRFGSGLLEQSGLVRRRQSGSGFYDYFRGRLMFPIHNESGKVIAFGGRALRAEDEPKYLNSPETSLYKKSRELFNMHRAKIDARKNSRMVLVEGYMDVLGVYAAGVHEVVASCGTALKSEQVRAIKRQISQQQAHSGQIIVNFDSDAAGARATEKYINTMLAEGLRVKVLELPEGVDPDEYIREHGAEAYHKRLANSGSYFHWLADRGRSRVNMNTGEGRMNAFRFVSPSIDMVNDRLERLAIANEIANLLGVDREAVREHLRRAKPRDNVKPQVRLSSSLDPNERLLLTCFLLNEEVRPVVTHFLRQRDFSSVLQLNQVFKAAIALEEEGVPFSVDAVSTKVDDRVQRILAEISFYETGLRAEDALGQVQGCLEQLERKSVEQQEADLKRRIREYEATNNLAAAMELMTQLANGKSASYKR